MTMRRLAWILVLATALLLSDHILDGMRGLGPWWQP